LGQGIDGGYILERMAKITLDREFSGIEELKTIFRQFAVGSENQERLLY